VGQWRPGHSARKSKKETQWGEGESARDTAVAVSRRLLVANPKKALGKIALETVVLGMEEIYERHRNNQGAGRMARRLDCIDHELNRTQAIKREPGQATQ